MPAIAPLWFSSFGRLELRRSGDSVTGNYEHGGGTLDGSLEGSLLRGTWSERGGEKSGPFEIAFDPGDNTFRGSWKYEGDGGWRGRWNGVCSEIPLAGDGRSLGSWNGLSEGPLLAGPMLGEPGTNEARVWIQARDEGAIELVVEAPDGRQVRVTAQPTRSQWLCLTLVAQGLEPDTMYGYWLESANGRTERARLRTAPSIDARRARFAFGSCYDAHEEPLPIFEAMARENPDALLMIGDNCYYFEPDWQSEHTMMLAQLRNRNNPTFRPFGSNVPVLAVWDDHDFGPNDSDSRFASKDISLRVFQRVWGQRSYGLPDVTGIFSIVRWGPVEMFLLDGRYERLEKRQILGARQLAWLEERLVASSAPVKLIVTASQLLPLAAVEKEWECWRRDAPEELERLLDFVAERDVRGVVYISGDVHLGYLLHDRGRLCADGSLGPETWELTASPLSNDPWHETLLRPGQPHDPYIVREFAEQNYGVVDVDLDRTGDEIHLVLKDGAGRTLVDQGIALADLVSHRGVEGESSVHTGARVNGFADEPTLASGAEPQPRGSPSISAALLRERRRGDPPIVELVLGDAVVVYDLEARVVVGQPSSVHAVYPGAARRGIDSAVVWPNGKAYFFSGRLYWRFDLERGRVDQGFPVEIEDHWPGLFPSDIDAVIPWGDGKAFFFRGPDYLRYDIDADRVDRGYPLAIAGHWSGLWPEGIDAALGPVEGKVWFFRGRECLRFDVAADRADPGYPRAVEDEFPASCCPHAEPHCATGAH